jgi:hypothetical protein
MRYMLLLLLFVLVGTPVVAQRVVTYEQVTVADSSIGITAAIMSGKSACGLRLETAEIRWRPDGSVTAPTSAIGTIMKADDVLVIENIIDAQNFRAIRTGATSGLLSVWCWPQR